MDITSISSRLRYLDASDVDDPNVTFDGLPVRGSDGHKLGDLDGFLVDEVSGRVYYTVVDTDGWFRSRRLLLPIGHARLADDRHALHVDLPRQALRGYPAFDEDRFPEFTDEEWRAFEQRMAVACCPDDDRDLDEAVHYDTLRHYAQPDWWRADHGSSDHYQPLGRRTWRERRHAPGRDVASPALTPTRSAYDRELITARGNEGGDVSPQPEGKARPGDVPGIETGGERTHLSDRGRDEDKPRRGE